MKKILFLLILAAAGVGAWFYFHNGKTDAPQYQTAAVQRGDLTQAVTATGTLNPVVNVQVGSQVSGNIQKLHADFNSEVKKGQIVAQLDPATFQAAVNQAEGELASAQSSLRLAEFNVNRQRELAKNKISTQADLDQAEATLLQAQASVKIRSAQVEKAKVDLGRCTIYAPIDGIVISREVDVGQTVAASMSAPIIFRIANDLRNMQIDANVAEADVGNIAVDQKVEFTVEAFQYRTFRGKVAQVRNAPITVQNVVSYDTVIAVTNEDLKLKPGMTATVSIITAERPDVLKVPNAALRFRPADAPTPQASARGPGGGSGRGERRGPPGGAGGRSRERGGTTERTVYTLVNGKPQPVTVKLGISDSIFTEVLDGLKEGDQVITGTTAPQAEATPSGASNPFSGGGRRRF
jgi:HlyD family secretion protein